MHNHIAEKSSEGGWALAHPEFGVSDKRTERETIDSLLHTTSPLRFEKLTTSLYYDAIQGQKSKSNEFTDQRIFLFRVRVNNTIEIE